MVVVVDVAPQWGEGARQLLTLHEGEVAQDLKQRLGLNPGQVLLKGERLQASGPGTLGLKGDEYYAQICTNIACYMGIERSETQVIVHRKMLMALLPLIYRDDWEHHRERIMAYYKLKLYKQFFFWSASRRDGKSYAKSMMLASCMHALPALRAAVFTISDRVSGWMMELVLMWFYRLPNARSRVLKKNHETFKVSAHGRSDERYDSTLLCMPNTEKARGITFDWACIDEAEFVDPNLWFNVIAPVVQLKQVVVMAISSPEGSQYNYIREIFAQNAEDPESPYEIFDSNALCELCVKERNTVRCPHKPERIVKWKSPGRRRAQEKLYANNVLKFRREIMGVPDSTDIQAFDAHKIKAWFTRPLFTCYPSAPYPFVFVSIDPGGGGSASDTAIILSTFDMHNNLVILGADTVMMMDSISEKEMNVLHQLIRKVRRFPAFASSILVLIVESNHCWIKAKDFTHQMRAYEPIRYVYDDPKMPSRPGVWVDDQDKERFVQYFNKFLMNDQIVLHDPFFTTEEDPNRMKGYLQTQFNHFRSRLKDPSDPAFADSKRVYTGKAKGGGMKDDLVMACLFSLYHSAIFLATPQCVKPQAVRMVEGVTGLADFHKFNPHWMRHQMMEHAEVRRW